MKRRTFLLNSSALFGSSFTGPGHAQSRIPISWWYASADPEAKDYIQKLLIDKFHARHPEYELTIDFRGGRLATDLHLALLSGTGPDIVESGGPSYIVPYATAGHLLPLDDYAARLGWNDRLLKFFLDGGRLNGKLYSVPVTYETLGTFYNKSLFERKGWQVPRTIDELEALAEEAKAQGMVPIGLGNADFKNANEWPIIVVFNTIAGPDALGQALSGEIPFTSEPFVRAIDTLKRWWDNGYFGDNYHSLTIDQAFAQVATGAAAVSLNGTWSFGWVKDFFTGVDAPGYAPLPTGTGIDYPVYPVGVGDVLSISAASKVPDGAAAVIDYVFTPEFYSDMNSVLPAGWNTALRDLSDVHLAPTADALYVQAMKDLSEAIDDNHFGYTTYTYFPPETGAYLTSGLDEVWLNRATTAEFLTRLQTLFDKERAEAKVPPIPRRA